MKKLFMFLCVVIMLFGIAGCPSDDPSTLGTKSATPTSVTTSDTVSDSIGNDASPVPEPATLILLGSGLVGLAGFGRKKFFKK